MTKNTRQSMFEKSPIGHDCPICNSTACGSFLLNLSNNRVYRCRNCDGEYCLDLPDPVAQSRAYQSFDAGELARKSFSLYTEQAANILDNELESYLLVATEGRSKINFLDYGCGGGHFVAAAKKIGMNSFGVELDSTSVAFGKSMGLDVWKGTFPEDIFEFQRDFQGIEFDFVRMMHVIEHVPSPFATIEALVSITKSTGFIVVAVPDQGSFPAKLKQILRYVGIKRSEWGFVQPPIHLHGFYQNTFSELARKLGVELLSVTRSGPLDQNSFPAAPEYWDRLIMQKFVYRIGSAIGSPGHIKAILRKL